MSQLSFHQKKAVEALENIQNICEKHGIKPFLLAGTALGAVRHKGFIPWDDDIDIGFTYEDWLKVKKILSEELDRQFEYADYDTKESFPRMFGKVLFNQQNCVDLFLIAKWTKNKIRGNLHWQIKRFAVECYKYSIHYNAPIKPNLSEKQIKHIKKVERIRKSIYSLIKWFCKPKDFIRLAQWNERFFEKRKSDCYINLYSLYKMDKEILKKEWIEETSLVMFENHYYQTVGDTDVYLTHLYGDYMTPPPEFERISTHQEVFY